MKKQISFDASAGHNGPRVTLEIVGRGTTIVESNLRQHLGRGKLTEVIERMLLAHASEGVNITDARYISGIYTVMEAMTQ